MVITLINLSSCLRPFPNSCHRCPVSFITFIVYVLGSVYKMLTSNLVHQLTFSHQTQWKLYTAMCL